MTTALRPAVRSAPIEGFPRYRINELNQVWDTESSSVVPHAKFDGISYVELILDDKPYLMHVNRLRWASFNLPIFSPLEPAERKR